MKLFITIISLIICQQFQAQATEFTEERANKLGRDFRSPYVISQYNKETGLDFDDLDSTEKEYRLTSGVDVRVSKAALSQISTYSMPKKLKGIFLTSDFQTFFLDEDEKFKIELRHLYGKDLTSPISSDDKTTIIFALLISNTPLKLHNKMHQITIIESFINSGNRFYIENLLTNHFSDFIIRSLHPLYNGTDFAIFLPNKNPYSLLCGTEELIATFKIEQVPCNYLSTHVENKPQVPSDELSSEQSQ